MYTLINQNIVISNHDTIISLVNGLNNIINKPTNKITVLVRGALKTPIKDKESFGRKLTEEEYQKILNRKKFNNAY